MPQHTAATTGHRAAGSKQRPDCWPHDCRKAAGGSSLQQVGSPPCPSAPAAAHIQIHGDIDVDDVSVPQRPRVGDAVADALVHRRAHRLRELAWGRGAGVVGVPHVRAGWRAGGCTRSRTGGSRQHQLLQPQLQPFSSSRQAPIPGPALLRLLTIVEG